MSVKYTQEYLKSKGYQLVVDGQWGPESKRVYQSFLAETRPKQRAEAIVQGFPRDEVHALIKFAGTPEQAGTRLTRVAFPWKCFYGTKLVASCSIHERVASSLATIFNELWDLSGQNQQLIDKWGLSNYDGTYNNRPISGGQRPSTHAFGLAIDLSAETNPNSSHTGGRGRATIPEEVIDVFESHGWKSGGRAWGRDYMHFQATQ